MVLLVVGASYLNHSYIFRLKALKAAENKDYRNEWPFFRVPSPFPLQSFYSKPSNTMGGGEDVTHLFFYSKYFTTV